MDGFKSPDKLCSNSEHEKFERSVALEKRGVCTGTNTPSTSKGPAPLTGPGAAQPAAPTLPPFLSPAVFVGPAMPPALYPAAQAVALEPLGPTLRPYRYPPYPENNLPSLASTGLLLLGDPVCSHGYRIGDDGSHAHYGPRRGRARSRR